MHGDSTDPTTTALGSAPAGSAMKKSGSPNIDPPSSPSPRPPAWMTTTNTSSPHPPTTTISHRTVLPGEAAPPLSTLTMPTLAASQQQQPKTTTATATSARRHSPTISMLSGPDLSTAPPASQNTTTPSVLSEQLQAKIDLWQVLETNPLESEAEAYVLRSIEARDEQHQQHQQQQQQATAADSNNPSLLGAVPDHAHTIFSNNNQEAAADLPLRSRTFSSASQQQPTPSFASTSGGATTATRVKKKQPPQSHHRGKSTMEETLQKLTGQLHDVHSQEQKRFGLSSITAQMMARDKARLLVQENSSSGDRLGQAAHVLLRKNATTAPPPPQSHAESSSTATTPSVVQARWGKLRTSVLPSAAATGGISDASGGGSSGGNTNRPSAAGHESTTTTSHGATATSDSTSNWRKLRLSVHTTSAAMAAGRAKKNDDVAAANEDDDTVDGAGQLLPHNSDLEMGRLASDEDAIEEENYFDDDEMDDSKHRNRLQRVLKDSLIGDLSVFAKQRQKELRAYIRLVLFALFPGIGLACILFYWGGNTPTGIIDWNASTSDLLYNTKGKLVPLDQASYSWWVLFVGVRQLLALSLAKLVQAVFIDFFCLNTRIMTRVVGQLVTLLIVQSRGWPFLFISWSCINFGLNYGSSSFHKHWAYWQDVLEVFNDANPSGGVQDNEWYFSVLIVAISWGGAVALKRLWLGLYLGRKTYTNYAEELARVMQKILLLCEVAALGRELEMDTGGGLPPIEGFGISREDFNDMLHMYDDENADDASIVTNDFAAGKADRSSRPIISPKDLKVTGSFTDKHKSIINELLGAWEEPDREVGVEEVVSISGILQFRQSLQYLESTFFFSIAWGDVGTREKMIISSQNMYRRLMCRLPRRALLSFDVLALCCVEENGSLDLEKMKTLIKLLRPDRDGKLTMIDFVKSVDTVYKEARLLRASVKNSERIDRAFERVINVAFYGLLFIFTLPQLGFDPMAVFLSFSSIIVGFAFMIGPAASKMFEGWLFILLRRPYDIGDRIHIALPNTDPGPHGSASWFVRDVDLFTTTCVFASTGEKATLNNGSLAMFRVVNLARSPNPVIHLEIKFAFATPLSKIQIFEEAVRKFVQSRPREWAQFIGFRPSNIMQEQSYVEYKLLLQHRETWQNAPALGKSKAEVASFCLELTKKLDMKYTLPAMPVELSMPNKAGGDSESTMMAQYRSMVETAGDDVAAMFLPGTTGSLAS